MGVALPLVLASAWIHRSSSRGTINTPRSAPACSIAVRNTVSTSFSSTISLETACETFSTVASSNCSTRAPIVPRESGTGSSSLRRGLRSFLDTVVHKSVAALQALDQLQADPLPQVRVDLLLGRSAHERERWSVGSAAEAGELLQRLLRPRRQAGQLPHHQVRDVGRVSLRVDALEVP